MVFPEPAIGARLFPAELCALRHRLLPREGRRRARRRDGDGRRERRRLVVTTERAPSTRTPSSPGSASSPTTELAAATGPRRRRRHRRRRATAAPAAATTSSPPATSPVSRVRARPPRARRARGPREHPRATRSARTWPAPKSRTTTCRSSTPTCSTSATRRSASSTRGCGRSTRLGRSRTARASSAYVDDESRPRGFLLWNVWGKVDAATRADRGPASRSTRRRLHGEPEGSSELVRALGQLPVAVGDAPRRVGRPAHRDTLVADVMSGWWSAPSAIAARRSTKRDRLGGRCRTRTRARARRPPHSDPAHDLEYSTSPQRKPRGCSSAARKGRRGRPTTPATTRFGRSRTSSSRAAPLRVPPPAVVLAAGATGSSPRSGWRAGDLVAAALLLQLKTVLDNADGQLARLTGNDLRARSRYLDSESDLLVDAALFAALGWVTGRPVRCGRGLRRA